MNFRRAVLRTVLFFFVSTALKAGVLFDSTVNPIFAFDVVSSSPSIHASFSTGARQETSRLNKDSLISGLSLLTLGTGVLAGTT